MHCSSYNSSHAYIPIFLTLACVVASLSPKMCHSTWTHQLRHRMFDSMIQIRKCHKFTSFLLSISVNYLEYEMRDLIFRFKWWKEKISILILLQYFTIAPSWIIMDGQWSDFLRFWPPLQPYRFLLWKSNMQFANLILMTIQPTVYNFRLAPRQNVLAKKPLVHLKIPFYPRSFN